ncbi:MAG: D-glycero-beta-D-manno-heptose 1-phosphate adenylyltransferase [Nostocaceae cyanobacterium]|nr:D-glycero-beta-D-manno-heptose 1-phosphate adenylyltransferase [Nostocaceae cyanobacterium]
MNPDFTQLGKNILIIGDAILQRYLMGEGHHRFLTINQCQETLAGAAKTAVDIHRLGKNVTFFSVVGNDAQGDRIKKALQDSGVSPTYVFVEEQRQTLVQNCIFSYQHMLYQFVEGSSYGINQKLEQQLIERLESCFTSSDSLIICNSNNSIFTDKISQTISKFQHKSADVVVIDPPSILTPEKHIANPEELLTLVTTYRQAGYKIVFTNGCFDILHAGHVSYLNRAKALGDILIIGVNSDNSVRRLKGLTRPINSLEDRIQVLGGLGCVDHLIAFEQDSPSNLLGLICPDIYVKGGDYTRETLPETPVVEEYGGVIEFLPFLENRSTTRIIHQISQLGNG